MNFSENVRAFYLRHPTIGYQERRDVTLGAATALTEPDSRRVLTFASRVLLDDDGDIVAEAQGGRLKTKDGYLYTVDTFSGRTLIPEGEWGLVVVFLTPFLETPIMVFGGIEQADGGGGVEMRTSFTVSRIRFAIFLKEPAPAGAYLHWRAMGTLGSATMPTPTSPPTWDSDNATFDSEELTFDLT